MIQATNTKATLYLDSELYRALKIRAAETGESVSSLMNEALQAQLSEDLEDIRAVRSRIAEKEKPLSYESALANLRKNAAI